MNAQQQIDTDGRRGEDGFTLMEMLLALTIMSLLAVVAAETIGRKPEALQRQEIAGRVMAALDKARREAAAAGAIRTVDVQEIDADAALAPEIAGVAGAKPLFLAYPDGSTTGGTLTIGGRPQLRIDWLTGEARDAS